MPGDTYHWLALYYDHLFDFRRPFDKARQTVLEPVLRGIDSACDLCCGTGDTAIRYAAAGLRTYAVDLSPHMCRLTRKKSREAGLRLRVLQADMRSFVLPEKVNLVTCEFDALNHVPRKSDLAKVAKAVARALRPGGWFVFDVNTRAAFESVWSGTWWVEKDPVAMVMHGGHKRGSDKAWTDVEWFVRKGKLWERHHEHVEEVCWSEGEIRAALSGAGFGRLRAWDAAPFFEDGFTRPAFRTFWRAQKQATT